MSITGNKKLLTIIEQAKKICKTYFLNIRKFIFKEKSLIKLDSPFFNFLLMYNLHLYLNFGRYD